MSRFFALLALAACGQVPAAGSEGSGGEGDDPCAGVELKLLGGGPDFSEPLRDGDTVQWQQGPDGGCYIWTGLLAHGFTDSARILARFQVFSADGTDWSAGQGFCEGYELLTSDAGWRADTCLKDRIDSPACGRPGEGTVKLKVTVRDQVTYDPTSPTPCTAPDVPHCEASAEAAVFAMAADSFPASCSGPR